MAHLLQRLKLIYQECADLMGILLQLILLDSLKHCDSCTGNEASDVQTLLDTETCMLYPLNLCRLHAGQRLDKP